MAEFGYSLSSEEHHPNDLVRNTQRAEAIGFPFACISDHYHPWISAQGHSPFVWNVVGAIATATERIRLGIGVTCPIMRIHPAILAQASATSGAMMEGRFFFGVGTGEALNEHILGQHWPSIEVRLDMMREAVEIIRELWKGEMYDHHGRYYTVENARLYTVPEQVPDIIVSAMGPKAAEVAADIGDGYWGTSPDSEVLQAYADAGGTGPRYGQLTLCWAEDKEQAKKTLFEQWPNTAVTGQLSQDLPTPTHFEMAAQMLTPDQVAESVPHGPDPGPVLESVQEYLDAGYTHVYFHQVGGDQDGFFRFFESELAPKLPS
jgi:G6PDH family F420-dependent oxidoreductase